MKTQQLTPAFVDFIPGVVQEGILYLSLTYGTGVHKCCCGCGLEVVTPLTPTDWQLIYDGETVSLYPSIGNWDFPCRSHYWITQGQVEWAGPWSQAKIEEGRRQDWLAKKHYFALTQPAAASQVAAPAMPTAEPATESSRPQRGFLRRAWRALLQLLRRSK